MLDGDETDTFFHRTGFSGLEEQFAAFGKTPFQAGPDDGRGFRALCGVDHEAIGGKPLLPLLVQPGKVHVIAMDFGKRPGHEQFEALLEQRKIGRRSGLRKSPASPASRKHTESGSRIFQRVLAFRAQRRSPSGPEGPSCDRRGLISAGVLEGTVFLGGYSGDRFFVAESLVGVHYLKRGKLLNSILDIVFLLIFVSACAFVGTFA